MSKKNIKGSVRPDGHFKQERKVENILTCKQTDIQIKKIK